MSRTPACVLLGSVLLLITPACSVDWPETPSAAVPPGVPTAVRSPSPSPSLSPSPAGAPSLTKAQTEAALIGESDLGEPWAPTEGAATWRDGVLKAVAQPVECQRLLDSVYTDELFGTAAGTRAVVALDDVWDGAQLRYQVVTQHPAEAESTLAWLRSLPRKCATFAATTAQGAVREGQVSGLELPGIGDARQAVRLTLTGEPAEGEFTLTLDVAAVRVGDDALALTNGGVGAVSAEVTQGVAELGAARLAEVRERGRTEV
ncbi:hypothetical protein [Streptomyces blattellae]|uniref:hypothetical protein n=1 Tax=Streptomyces blattellae TaxID=2569855 RepID=UPI0012B9AAF0|nr:hypothetical protein [Streptomyces blattellae]